MVGLGVSLRCEISILDMERAPEAERERERRAYHSLKRNPDGMGLEQGEAETMTAGMKKMELWLEWDRDNLKWRAQDEEDATVTKMRRWTE
jgi:hypothetical protein